MHPSRKLLAHGELLRRLADGRDFRPVHLRLGIGATGDAIALIREFASHGGRAVTFGGGPVDGDSACTAHPGYPAVCDAAHEEGLRIGLDTDGSRLDHPAVAECVASTHTRVRIRLGGPPGACSPSLPEPGRLRQSAIDPDFRIGFHCPVTAGDHRGIVPAARAARDAGAHYIRFEPEFPGTLGLRSIAALQSLMHAVTEALSEAAALADGDFAVSFPAEPEQEEAGEDGEAGGFAHCHYSRFVTTVDPDGHLYPCPQVHGHAAYRLGNVVEHGYAAVLDGEPRAAWQAADPLRTDVCGSCAYRPQNELLERVRDGRVPPAATDRAAVLHAEFV
ncbi:SPASM domain-containing protein [Streptomyces sp. NPDC049577]|uniref:SPASM domain-containing protein n=1 Tax=Streptomyces sp. NPDC049577 TaxID=3155153 RepID=UPI00343FB782